MDNVFSNAPLSDSDKALSPFEFVQAFIEQLRPRNPNDVIEIRNRIQSCCFVLKQTPEKAQYIAKNLLELMDFKNAISLYSDLGIQPMRGFWAEIYRRFWLKVLPEASNPHYLKDIFGELFSQPKDAIWISQLDESLFSELLHSIFQTDFENTHIDSILGELKEATQILSYRISASGLDSDLIRNHTDLENFESPFIMQNVELMHVLSDNELSEEDVKQLDILLSQCDAIVIDIKQTHAKAGTSIALTALMQRILQQTARMRLLLSILHNIQHQKSATFFIIRLLKDLVFADSQKNGIRDWWRQNMELMALRITENASHTGEHYITSTRKEYYQLFRSALGAGVIIAFMAINKLLIHHIHPAPLTEAILYSLNYGFGFVIIHLLHFTVATKQPAMTASKIASAIDESQGSKQYLERVTHIISQTVSSQTIAILGNILMVIPFSILIDQLLFWKFGHHMFNSQEAESMLASNDPIHSLALLYAAVAGVCLFLSGLIAGYHDNKAAYNQIEARIVQLKRLKRYLGEPRLRRIANYIHQNLGALAGNFYFGCLLGLASGLGVMLGIPLDIRHVTFVASFSGYAVSSLDFSISINMLFMILFSIFSVATINLITSFFLALYVAMKSRKLRLTEWKHLLINTLKELNQHPGKFFFAPKQ